MNVPSVGNHSLHIAVVSKRNINKKLYCQFSAKFVSAPRIAMSNVEI